jgi:DNA modification methylase
LYNLLYLILVLDPMMGAGTTDIAALKAENLLA